MLEINPQEELANYLQAMIAYRLGNQAKARQAISLLLKVNPKHKGVLWISGALDYRKKRYDDAQKNLEAYLEHNPNHYSSSKMLAAIYIKIKRESDAIKLILPFKKFWDYTAYSILADAYKQIGKLNKSDQFYVKASKLKPKDKSLQSKILMNKLRRGEDISTEVTDEQFINLNGIGFPKISRLILKQHSDEAIKTINQYLIKNPKEHELFHLLGHAYMLKEDLNKAEVNYKKAITIKQNFIPAYLRLARIYIQQDKNEFARREYQQILNIDPKHEITILNMAKLSQLDKNYPEMEKWLNKARLSNNYSTAPRLLLNQYYLAKREIKKALEMTQELIDSFPKRTKFLKLHAENLYAHNELDFAVITYKKILELNPNSAQAYFWLGSAEFLWKDYKSSRQHLKANLKLDPSNLISQITLIKINLIENKLTNTLTRAKHIIKTNPNNPLAYTIKGDVHLAYKQVSKAIASFEKAFELMPNNPVILNKLAKTYALSGKIKIAIKLFKQWIDKNSKDTRARMKLALLYQQTKQYVLAQNHYELILKTQPKNIEVINNLALVYEQLNDPRSFEFAEVAYTLAPNTSYVLDTLGWILVRNGDVGRGLSILKKAAELSPSELDIVYHYAVALVEVGKTEMAIKELKIITSMSGMFTNRTKANILMKKIQAK